MASWLQEFRRQPAVAGGKHGGGGAGRPFGSSAVFIELQLRQALAATQLTQNLTCLPDGVRVRVPLAAAGGGIRTSRVLSLLRHRAAALHLCRL